MEERIKLLGQKQAAPPASTEKVEYPRKIVWASNEADKFLLDYTKLSYVFFCPSNISDEIPELNDKNFCLSGKWCCMNLGEGTTRKDGFCFKKSSPDAEEFMNKLLTGFNDDEEVKIRDLIKFDDKPKWEKKEYKTKDSDKKMENIEITGIPKTPGLTVMDIFFNMVSILEGKSYSTNASSLFAKLIDLADQKCRISKDKQMPDGSICIFGTVEKVKEYVKNYLDKNETEKNSENKWEIKNEMNVGDNKIVRINKPCNEKMTVNIEKLEGDKISLSGSINQVNKALEKYTDEKQDDVYKILYEYETGENKVCYLLLIEE